MLILPGEILGHDQPCNMDNYRTRGKNRPHPAGSSVHGTDGALVTIKDIDPSAWDRLLQENEFNAPPVRGQRILILRVEAANTHGAGGIDVDERYFELSGSGGNVYETFKNACGVYPDPLTGILYPGDELQGNLCFRVETKDTNLVLIHNPEWSGEKTYLALEPDGDFDQ